MLIPHNVLSKSNTGLTGEMAKLVLSSAPRLSWDTLKGIKAKADSPILNDESLFDELSMDARSHFVMEPYFPRRLVDQTTAWMFEVSTIEEIDAEAAKRFANSFRMNKERGHDVRGFLRKLSEGGISKELHGRLLTAFMSAAHSEGKTDGQLMRYATRLLSHKHTTLAQYLASNGENGIYYDINPDVDAEFADAYLELCVKDNLKFWEEVKPMASSKYIVEGARVAFGLKNVSQGKRKEVINRFGLEDLDAEQIHLVYGGVIPDDALKHMLEKGLITDDMPKSCVYLITDERVPLKKALRLVEESPTKFAMACLSRADLDEKDREFVISKVLGLVNHPDAGKSERGIDTLCVAIEKGFVSLDRAISCTDEYADVIFAKATFKRAFCNGESLPVEMKDKYICQGFISIEQVMLHHDVDALLEAIRRKLIDNQDSVGGGYLYWSGDVGISFVNNPNWTPNKLLELVELFSSMELILGHPTFSADVRRAAFSRLFGEHVYPSVISGAPLGDGLAERAVASLLNLSASIIDGADLDLLSRIDFDYDRKDVDIGAALAKYPEIHEVMLSNRLMLKMNEIPDQPNPTLSRVRPSI
ncbi:hypothetical protein ACK32R_04695 [Aeromonas dhakensis]|uniref:hypothetical protein n=1 Tax=Aeromonas dhakensis TaxID=196024 RepID=UPI0039879EB7